MFEVYRPLMEEWKATRQAVLQSLTTNSPAAAEDWWRSTRRRPLDAAPPRSLFATGHERHQDPRHETKQRFARLAAGAHPAVVKVVGFGGGKTTARLVSYISRDGQVRVENEIGQGLSGPKVASEIASEWSHLFQNREKSQDVGLFQMDISPRQGALGALERDLAKMRDAFGDRPFAAAVDRTGPSSRIEGMVVLHSPAGGRMIADQRSAAEIEARLDKGLNNEAAASVQFVGHGHGVRFAAAELRKLVERHPGHVWNEKGAAIVDAKAASRTAHRDWRKRLESRAPRDNLHLIIAVSAATSASSFETAVADFLAKEFGGHRYVFAIHDPVHDPKKEGDGGKRAHLHAHAVIATRSDYGERLTVWVTDLDRWRSSFAESARTQGIAIEFTRRHETLSAPAYTHTDVRPISFIGRTRYEGVTAAAQRRYDAKRSGHAHLDSGQWAQAQARLAREIWQDLAQHSATARGRDFAETMVDRFDGIARDAAARTPDRGSRSNTQFIGLGTGPRDPEARSPADSADRQGEERKMEAPSRDKTPVPAGDRPDAPQTAPKVPEPTRPKSERVLSALTAAVARVANAELLRSEKSDQDGYLRDEKNFQAGQTIKSGIVRNAQLDRDEPRIGLENRPERAIPSAAQTPHERDRLPDENPRPEILPGPDRDHEREREPRAGSERQNARDERSDRAYDR